VTAPAAPDQAVHGRGGSIDELSRLTAGYCDRSTRHLDACGGTTTTGWSKPEGVGVNTRVSTSTIAASAAVLMSLSLVGCGADDSKDSATSSSSSNSAGSTTASGDVVALAEAFAATLDEDQATALQQDYTFDNASNWSNFPNALLTGGGMPSGGSSGSAPSGGMPSGGSGAPTGSMPSGGSAPSGGGAGSSSSTGRVGLQTDSLSDEQWSALEDLLAGATGSSANEPLV